MRYALIALVCIPLMLLAGCGNSTPDNMVASVYSIEAFGSDHAGNPTVAGAKPLVSWHVTNAPLVQKLYQHLAALPVVTAMGGNSHCDPYGEVLTFQSGSTALSQLYSTPCPSSGLYITTLAGRRGGDAELLQLLKQATGYGLFPAAGLPPTPTPSP
jgi:hypothetical protein